MIGPKFLFSILCSKISFFVRRAFSLQSMISLRNFRIALPGDHLLPHYKKFHKKYDEFLPLLVSFLPSNQLIVDVGANVGDSVAFVADRSPDHHFVCVEPDPEFFRMLVSNVKRIEAAFSDSRFTCVNALIGDEAGSALLVGSGGTKSAVRSIDDGISFQRLDDVLSAYGKVRLIKIDVDGYDFDVINSGVETIRRDAPLLFFECQFVNNVGFQNYLDVIEELAGRGYGRWVVFDNFGGLMLRTNRLVDVRGLLLYLLQQERQVFSRTVYYFDILAVHDDDSLNLEDVIEAYL